MTQAAVVKDLLARHDVPSPAHPSHDTHWHQPHSLDLDLASHGQLKTALHKPSPAAERVWSQPQHLLTPGANSTPETASTVKQRASHRRKHDGPETHQQLSELQALFSDVDIARAVSKHPLLLSYCPATLQNHMQQLQGLVGSEAAASMVVRMPQLLHYKGSTLAAKLDHLYDLLPNADVSKASASLAATQALTAAVLSVCMDTCLLHETFARGRPYHHLC